jgi:hypothetical protein
MARRPAGAWWSTIASRHRVSIVRLLDYDGPIVERFWREGCNLARMNRRTVVSIVLLILEHDKSLRCVTWAAGV